MKVLRFWLGNIVYFLAGLLVFFFGLRLIVELFGLSSPLKFFIDFTNLFFSPFANTFGVVRLGGSSFIDLSVVYAIFAVIFIAYLIEQIVLIPFQYHLANILIELVLAIFRILEIVFFGRFVFMLFSANQNAGLVSLVMNITKPLDGLLSLVNLRLGDIGVIELVTLAVIVVLIILDNITESFLIKSFGSVRRIKDRGLYRIRRIRTVEYYE